MNRYLLVWLMAIAILATVGCRPRHPPHTPQPFSREDHSARPILVDNYGGLPYHRVSSK